MVNTRSIDWTLSVAAISSTVMSRSNSVSGTTFLSANETLISSPVISTVELMPFVVTVPSTPVVGL